MAFWYVPSRYLMGRHTKVAMVSMMYTRGFKNTNLRNCKKIDKQPSIDLDYKTKGLLSKEKKD